ncbi:hypothetical protein [Streptomyces pinistramenti]|uniref:hypothetical protein n=1 Tax=Streptomyces pinistramenti TaxID=2884812 RepID=UPI0027E53E69|nr:hypothetical protein [Streptomyces pinistramenti]
MMHNTTGISHQRRRRAALGAGTARRRGRWRARRVRPLLGPFPARGRRLGPELLQPVMMAAKARLFGDEEAERRAIAAGHPRQAKAAGPTVRGFDDAVRQEHRFGLVVPHGSPRAAG